MYSVYSMFVCLFVWFISSKVFNNTRTLEKCQGGDDEAHCAIA